jgi:Permeases of the major facilitator superfamily
MVSYAIGCGIPAMAAVSIYSVEGLSGLGGRLLFGVLADRLGVKLVLVAGLLLQAFAIATYLVVSQLGEFYALSVVFGTAYGGVMPLYAVLAREYFGAHHGNGVRRGDDGFERRHGIRPLGGRLHIRHLRRL